MSVALPLVRRASRGSADGAGWWWNGVVTQMLIDLAGRTEPVAA